MFSFFNKNKKLYTKQRTDISYQFKTLQRYMVTDLNRVIEYYKTTRRYVTSSDALYRMMKFQGFDSSMSYIEYITGVDNILKLTHRHFRIASYYNHGVFDGLNHYYMEYKQTYDVFATSDELLKIPALVILSTDNQSLYYPNPVTAIESFSIRGVDLKLLMIQYYHWFNLTDTNKSMKTFLDTVVYPNAIESLSNMALINKTIFNEEYSIDVNSHPIYIMDLSSKFNTLVKSYIKGHKKGSILAADMLREMPVITGNALSFLRINYPMLNSYNSLPYFYMYARILKGLYNQMNGKSKRLFVSRLRSENLMFMKLRSLGLERIDFGELTEEKNELIMFFTDLIKGR